MKSKDPSKRPTRELKLEVLADILDRKIPALITANNATEITTALRLQKEFGFRMILDGVAEAYLVLDEPTRQSHETARQRRNRHDHAQRLGDY